MRVARGTHRGDARGGSDGVDGALATLGRVELGVVGIIRATCRVGCRVGCRVEGFEVEIGGGVRAASRAVVVRRGGGFEVVVVVGVAKATKRRGAGAGVGTRGGHPTPQLLPSDAAVHVVLPPEVHGEEDDEERVAHVGEEERG